MGRCFFVRKVQNWFGFTCRQVHPFPRYLSRKPSLTLLPTVSIPILDTTVGSAAVHFGALNHAKLEALLAEAQAVSPAAKFGGWTAEGSANLGPSFGYASNDGELSATLAHLFLRGVIHLNLGSTVVSWLPWWLRPSGGRQLMSMLSSLSL